MLEVGCGVSDVAFGLSQLGYEVVACDSSANAVARQRAQQAAAVASGGSSNVASFYVCDARALDGLPGGLGASCRYDAVLDKGLLDALLCYDGAAGQGHNWLRRSVRVFGRYGACVCVL